MARITPAEYTATVAKIAKINERASKKGFTGRVTIEAEQVMVTKKDKQGFEISYPMVDVTLGGEAPAYNGYRLLAVLDFDQHAGLVTRVAPGVDEVSIDRSALVAGHCAHCNVQRYRAKSYLVLNIETGEQVQVGSTCIKDFLGWTGTLAFEPMDEIEKDIEDGWGGGFGGGVDDYAVETVLAVAWAAIKAYGFVRSGSFDGMSTKDAVITYLGRSNDKGAQALRNEIGGFVEGSAAAAKQVRDFVLSEDFSGTSEYVINLKAVMAPAYVSVRNIGLVASAPQALARFEERTLIQMKEKATPSEWFGAEKEKVEFTGIISGVRYIESAYGSTVLYTLRNEETGAIVKWFASREALGDRTAVGTTVTIKGTVKNHEEFNGVKSTVLTRCKQV